MDTQARRKELSTFLKQRRDRIPPEAVGLPKGTRRRTPGLRREEVAQLAGVGVTWYTWLEQGRDISVSTQVLDSIARVLQLSQVERTYLFKLVRQELPSVHVQSATQISPTIQLILDSQSLCPAYFINWRWDVLAWNQLACLVLIDFETLPAHDRNILWLVFTNEEFRSKQANQPVVCQETVAHFRASCASYIGNSELTHLIERLHAVSSEFRDYWKHFNVLEKRSSFKEFNHPTLGRLKFEMVVLQMSDPPDTKLVMLVPLVDTLTRQKLEQLRS